MPMCSSHVPRQSCYILPCFFLFDRSHELLKFVLIVMASSISTSSSLSSNYHTHHASGHASRINDIVNVLKLMHKDAKIKQIICSSRAEINLIWRNIHSLQVKFTFKYYNTQVPLKLEVLDLYVIYFFLSFLVLQSLEESNLGIRERHIIQCALDELKAIRSSEQMQIA